MPILRVILQLRPSLHRFYLTLGLNSCTWAFIVDVTCYLIVFQPLFSSFLVAPVINHTCAVAFPLSPSIDVTRHVPALSPPTPSVLAYPHNLPVDSCVCTFGHDACFSFVVGTAAWVTCCFVQRVGSRDPGLLSISFVLQ